jgi:hypothetical protein
MEFEELHMRAVRDRAWLNSKSAVYENTHTGSAD